MIDGIGLQCRRDNDILYILMLDIFLFWLNWK